MSYYHWWKDVTDKDYDWQIARALEAYRKPLEDTIFRPTLMYSSVKLLPDPTKDDIICDLFGKCFYGIWHWRKKYYREYVRIDTSIEGLIQHLVIGSIMKEIEGGLRK